jgi:hypothetical protein
MSLLGPGFKQVTQSQVGRVAQFRIADNMHALREHQTVACEDGSGLLTTLRRGWNVANGAKSTMTFSPIIALRGGSKRNLFDGAPSVTKPKLFRRDRFPKVGRKPG